MLTCGLTIFLYFLHPAVVASSSRQISVDRPSSKGVKHEHIIVLMMHQKIGFCKQLEEGEKHVDLMKEYSVGSLTVCDIKSQKDQLIKFFVESESEEAFVQQKGFR